MGGGGDIMKDWVKSIVLKRRPEDNQGKPKRLRREIALHKICYSPWDGQTYRKHEAFAKVWRSRLQLRLSLGKPRQALAPSL